jgi:hypothetical protein
MPDRKAVPIIRRLSPAAINAVILVSPVRTDVYGRLIQCSNIW